MPEPLRWCAVCCTGHTLHETCPGELTATGRERHGWRVNVETDRGLAAYGVLLAPSFDRWRARIVTYPNVLWLAPGGQGTIKFVGGSEREAERQAVEFIRGHCRALSFTMRDELAPVTPDGCGVTLPARDSNPAPRKIRFLPVQFGVAGAIERAGTGNLSETGMFIITDLPVQSGTSLRMAMDIESRQVHLMARVMWMRREHHAGGAPGMGVRLQAPPPPYIDYVRQLL